jgi:hypothetical protein
MQFKLLHNWCTLKFSDQPYPAKHPTVTRLNRDQEKRWSKTTIGLSAIALLPSLIIAQGRCLARFVLPIKSLELQSLFFLMARYKDNPSTFFHPDSLPYRRKSV